MFVVQALDKLITHCPAIDGTFAKLMTTVKMQRVMRL